MRCLFNIAHFHQIEMSSNLSNSGQRPPFLSSTVGLSKDLHAGPFKQVIPMGRQRLCQLLLVSVILLPLLMFSARSAWTQEMASASETPIQLAGLETQFAAIPRVEIRFHPADEILSLPFAPNQGLARFRTLDIGYHLPPVNNAVPGLWQLAKIDGLQANESHFIDHTPIEWTTDFSTHNKVSFQTADPGADLAYYGHRIPWAGRALLNIGEKAKVHARVYRVVELIGPGLTSENPAPRASVGNVHVIGRGR